MAKKGGKLLGLMALGAAAAGTYYYLKQRDAKIPTDMEDEEDLDNFDEDLDDGPAAKPEAQKRAYTSLDFETVEKKVQDAVEKIADTADKAASIATEKLQRAAGMVEEFFDDRKTDIPLEAPEEKECEAPSEE